MRFVPLSLIGPTLLMVACATGWTVDKLEAPEADFAARRTYAWTKGDFGTPNEVDPAVLTRADRAMRSAIEEELARKGYVTVPDAAQADMHVSYQVAGQRRFRMPDDRPSARAARRDDDARATRRRRQRRRSCPVNRPVRDGTVIVFSRRPCDEAIDLARPDQRRNACRDHRRPRSSMRRTWPARSRGRSRSRSN